MRVLPGAACGEFEPFALGISRVQQLLGAHFAPAQGGNAYTSHAVGQLMGWLGAAGDGGRGVATGQSSWGPTGFAIVPSQAQAEALVESARAARMIAPALDVRIVQARNRGAELSERGLRAQR